MQDYAELNVLLIDPSQPMRTNLRGMLNQAGIVRIEEALTAGTAIRQISKKQYDIILCEYDLSGGVGDGGQDGQQLLEDLRLHDILSRWSIFFMLTSEGAYSKVVSAAELAPNDYILKPFTLEILLQRISRAIGRRAAFAPVYQLLDQDMVREAITASRASEVSHPRLATEFSRLRAELHYNLGELAEAELIYHTILAGRSIGWAHLGLARCQFGTSRYDEAVLTLDKLIVQNPRFMAAYDLLARTHEALGQPAQAKRVLEDAVAISPHMVHRLRHLGTVAYDAGDPAVSEKAFKQVMAKAKYSEFRDPEDHVNLVKALIKKGDSNQAGGVIRDLERSLRGNDNLEACRAFSSALLMQSMGNGNAAISELNAAVAAVYGARGLSRRIRLSLVDSCLQYKLDKDAAGVVIAMVNDDDDAMSLDDAVGVFEKAGRHDLARGVGETVNLQVGELLDNAASQMEQGDHKSAVSTLSLALRKAPNNKPVLYATISAMVRQLDELGWEAATGEQAGVLLQRLARIDGDNAEFDRLMLQYSGTQRKYGISTTA